MSTKKESHPDWEKQGLKRDFKNIEEFYNYKFMCRHKHFSEDDLRKLVDFENIVRQNQGEYFLLEHAPNGKKNPKGAKGDYIVGILSGKLCYPLNGKRFGDAFETPTELFGFLQYFYNKEILFRTNKRAYTEGGKLAELELHKIKEDPALNIKDILGDYFNCYFSNGSWINGHFKSSRKGRIKNGKNEGPYQITSATKAMSRLFIPKKAINLIGFLDCNLPESEWEYKEPSRTC